MPGIADMIGQIRKLQEENEKLKSELRGKENEINDLKERIAYLKQFKTKEKDIPNRNFKEKIAITKQFYGKAKIEIHKGYVYIERAM